VFAFGDMLLKSAGIHYLFYLNYTVGIHCDKLRSYSCRTFDMFNTASETIAKTQLAKYFASCSYTG
jgi:hypothetical protein